MRIEALTFLRFVAAIIVVFFHFGKKTELASYAQQFILSGPMMVTFFFVLSGFVLMVAHYNKNKETLRNYYMARIARIVPVYMLGLFLSFYLYFNQGGNDVISLLLSITFLQSWFPPYSLSLNGPAWSLSVEAFFYLAFPFILFAVKKSCISCKKFTILSLVFYLFSQAILSNLLNVKFYNGFPSISHDLIYYFPLSHSCSFVLGVSGGYIYAKHTQFFNKTGFLPIIVLILTFFVTCLTLQNSRALSGIVGFPLAYGSSFYSLLFILLILSVAYSKSIITSFMSMPFLVLLGESSYALYILQKPLYTIYHKYIARHFELSLDGHFYFFIFLHILTSIWVFYLIERPCKKMIVNANRC
ncbi:MAG: acyltransferase [Desulfocapsaceae bacterium]|nr:acyltransferase [Desulfocapsaceae bacterium]